MGGEAVAIDAGDKEVEMSVVIIVHPGAEAPVPGFAGNDAVGHFGECSIAVVVKE